MMTYIHFIINPVSGNGKHGLTSSHIRRFFPTSQFHIEVDYTQHKGHATDLSRDVAKRNPYMIVACGGDGTVNEVASSLVNTEICLGIVPVGSGNGLASNLSIPKKIDSALETIRHGNIFLMDVGKVNRFFFFSNMGIGIDALIIRKYERSNKRSLGAYVRAAISAGVSFKPREITATYNGKTVTSAFYMLFISNSNEMGYGMSLTPQASLADGFLDIVLIPKLSLLRQLWLGYHVLFKRVGNFKPAVHLQSERLEIETVDEFSITAQIDGEFHFMKANKLQVSLIKKGLKVCIAKT